MKRSEAVKNLNECLKIFFNLKFKNRIQKEKGSTENYKKNTKSKNMDGINKKTGDVEEKLYGAELDSI